MLYREVWLCKFKMWIQASNVPHLFFFRLSDIGICSKVDAALLVDSLYNDYDTMEECWEWFKKEKFV